MEERSRSPKVWKVNVRRKRRRKRRRKIRTRREDMGGDEE